MTERPIIFNGAMVDAIGYGRKTQTRRVVKGLPDDAQLITYYGDYIDGEFGNGSAPREALANSLGWFEFEAGDLWPCNDADRIKCPYGQVGDQLWVREKVWIDKDTKEFAYYANQKVLQIDRERDNVKLCPSIHMKRDWARIKLEVTHIRVERLNDISEEDALAEGLKAISKDGKLIKHGIPDSDGFPGNDDCGWNWHEWEVSPIKAFQKLWESINGAGSWAANPWVWVVEFKKL